MNQKGFTLVESLIAIALVFGGFSILFGGVDKIFKSQTNSNVRYKIRSSAYSTLLQYMKEHRLPRVKSGDGKNLTIIKCMDFNFIQIRPISSTDITGDLFKLDANVNSNTPPEDACPAGDTKYILKMYWTDKSFASEEDRFNLIVFYKRNKQYAALRFSRVDATVL